MSTEQWVDSTGALIDADVDNDAQRQALEQAQYRPATADDVEHHNRIVKYGGTAEQAGAALETAAGAATFGLLSSSSPESVARRQTFRELSPVSAFAANAAGAIAPAIATGGLGGAAAGAAGLGESVAAARGIGLASDIAAGVSSEAEASEAEQRDIQYGNVVLGALGFGVAGYVGGKALSLAGRGVNAAGEALERRGINVLPRAVQATEDAAMRRGASGPMKRMARSVGAAGAEEEPAKVLTYKEAADAVSNWDTRLDQAHAVAREHLGDLDESFDAVNNIGHKAGDYAGHVPDTQEFRAWSDTTLDQVNAFADVAESMGAKGTAKELRSMAAHTAEQTEAHDILYGIDRIKSRIQRGRKQLAVSSKRGGTDIFHEQRDAFDAAWTPIKDDLENPDIVGDWAAEKQLRENRDWTDKIIPNGAHVRDTFFEQSPGGADFDGMPHYQLSESKVQSFIDKGGSVAGRREQQRILGNLDEYIDGIEELTKTKKDLGAASLSNDFGDPVRRLDANIAAVKTLRRELDELGQVKARGKAFFKKHELGVLDIVEEIPGVGGTLARAVRKFGPAEMLGPEKFHTAEEALSAIKSRHGTLEPAPSIPPMPPANQTTMGGPGPAKASPADQLREIIEQRKGQTGAVETPFQRQGTMLPGSTPELAEPPRIRTAVKSGEDMAFAQTVPPPATSPEAFAATERPPSQAGRGQFIGKKRAGYTDEAEAFLSDGISGKSLKDMRALPLDEVGSERDKATMAFLRSDPEFRRTGKVADRSANDESGMIRLNLDADGNPMLVNGRHRIQAAREAGLDELPMRVVKQGPRGGQQWEWSGPVKVGSAKDDLRALLDRRKGQSGAVHLFERAEQRVKPNPLTETAEAVPESAVQPANSDPLDVLAEQESTQYGATPGGFYKGSDGVSRYVKFGTESDMRTEMAHNAMYNAFGVKAPVSAIHKVPKEDGVLGYEWALSSPRLPKQWQTISKAAVNQQVALDYVRSVPVDVIMDNTDVALHPSNLLTDGKTTFHIDNGLADFRGDAPASDVWEDFTNSVDMVDRDERAASRVDQPSQLINRVMQPLNLSATKSALQDGINRIDSAISEAGGLRAMVDKHYAHLPTVQRSSLAQSIQSRLDFLSNKVGALAALLVGGGALATAGKASAAEPPPEDPRQPYTDALASISGNASRVVDNSLLGLANPAFRGPTLPLTAAERFQGEFGSLQDAFMARSNVIGLATGNPGSFTAHIIDQYGSLGDTHPEALAAIVQRATIGMLYLQGNLPPAVALSLSQPNGLPPSQDAIRQFSYLWDGVFSPLTAVQDLAAGKAHPEQLRAIREVHPDIWSSLQRSAIHAFASLEERPPVQAQIYLDMILELDGAGNPAYNHVVADNIRSASQAQQPQAGKQPRAGQQWTPASPTMAGPTTGG